MPRKEKGLVYCLLLLVATGLLLATRGNSVEEVNTTPADKPSNPKCCSQPCKEQEPAAQRPIPVHILQL
jgi:hypothetical protein